MKLIGEFTFNPYLEKELDEKVRLVIHDNVKNEFSLLKILESREVFVLKHDELESHYNYKYKYQKLDLDTKRWTDLGDGYRYLIPEIADESGLKYAFYPSQNPSNYLVVCFQAIQAIPKYNYIRTIAHINAHRLYIKDGYGNDENTHSSYYLNEKNPIAVDDLVQSLINAYVLALDIPKVNTIFIGSSKGGYAGLYHGYKFGAGHISVGGPQTMLGDYLCVYSDSSIRSPIFRGIFGEENEMNKSYANNLMYKVLETSKKPFPSTIIHVGKGEPHYAEHAVPFMKWVDTLEINNVKWDFGDYNTHEDLAVHYPIFLEKSVKEIINSKVAQE
ncbi:hypothetical protein [Psychrobacter sp. SWN149]|uniref:hypothetical protein n=1 Tax=Psychrobacter sp. SWN149 TaxID=2792057 RepID=UPI0018CF017C|nr:hypothetical protein [Psychrobacter sp. SWN149]MBH0005393.1 hypothetical protein [Psychrobacter sp. SWN149]